MMYLGDYAEDTTDLNFKFTSVNDAGDPTTLGGVPAIMVYKANDTGTEVTTGVTLTADFDGITGLNNVLIDLSSAAFYAIGADYAAIITTGTVDGNSVVGTTVATFSIENRFTDVQKISGDAVAADNLEAVLDGSGVTADVDLTARSLTITNDAGVGVAVTGTTIGLDVNATSGVGIDVDGTTTGIAADGASLFGLQCTSAGIGGSGIIAIGTNGNGINAQGGGSSPGFLGTGPGGGIAGVGTGGAADLSATTSDLQVDVTRINGDLAAADNLESACDNYSATRGLSGTALPAAAADAAGGLPISDAGGLDLDTLLDGDTIADAILDRASGIEGGAITVTLRQAQRLILSALAGKLSGAGTTTVSIRDVNDGTDRIVAVVTAAGNRTAITLDSS